METYYGGESDIFDVDPSEGSGEDPFMSVFKELSGSDDEESDPVEDFIDRMRSDTKDDYGWLGTGRKILSGGVCGTPKLGLGKAQGTWSHQRR